MSEALHGRRVLVTRPAGQAAGLIGQLRAAGARVLHRPTLVIEPCEVDVPALPGQVDWVVFTSPNAVHYGIGHLAGLAGAAGRPRIAAVGPGTAAAAGAAGLAVSVAPARGGGAEALLAEAGFAPLPGETLLVIRGRGGRRRLQSALRERGVEVREIAVYQRTRPAGAIRIPARWRARRLDCTIVTSQAGLEHLLGMAGPGAIEWLQGGWLVSVSERVARAAMAAGFERLEVAAGASDEAITRAVCAALQREGDD